MKKTIITALLLAGSMSAVSQAQQPVTMPPAEQAPAEQPSAVSTVNEQIARLSSVGKTSAVSDIDYKLGPGDLIEIAVFEVPNFRHEIRINGTGVIKLPLLNPIEATGLTPTELGRKVASALEGDLIKDPQVSVFVKEYKSQPIFVFGAVRSPGQYLMTLPLKVVDVLSMAGGLAGNAGDEAIIQRRVDDSETTEVIKVNLRQLLDNSDLSLNVPMKGGDVLRIEDRPARNVYVLGEVNRSGAFQLPPKQDLRISQIIAAAGGPTKMAKMKSGMLVRYNDKGEREQLPVNFADILSGKKPDFLARADDIIWIPNSNAKNIAYGMLNMIPGMIMNVPYVIAY